MIEFIIYNLSCPSASFLAPLDSAHRVVFGRCILVSAIFHVAGCARMRFRYLISMEPTVTVIVRSLVRSLSFPSGFDIVF
jgi:hypothetical protein